MEALKIFATVGWALLFVSPFVCRYVFDKMDEKEIDMEKPDKDCRECKHWETCLCGKIGHDKGTSIGYGIGERKDYEEA